MMTLLRCLVFAYAVLAITESLPTDDAEAFCVEPDWFRCANGRCLSHWFVCDGDDECGDNSDEMNCLDHPNEIKNITCSEDQFQCQDKTCISLDDFCDREHDCPDQSDEYVDCTKTKQCKDFRCKNGYCVKNQWVCDGFDDCGDFSDEADCENRRIPPNECNNQNNRFLCDHGRCILLNEACNGKDDCTDNSDENAGSCKTAEETCNKGIGCSHNCMKTPRGPTCSCPPGHKLVDNRTCTDINECAEHFDLCDQRCINNAGSYACICDAGYELQEDGKTCRAEGGEALMILSTRKQIRGLYLKSQIYYPIAENLQHVLGVSLDANYIYWSDGKRGDEAIMRSREDGTKQEVIVTAGLGRPDDVAVDWITGNVYFTDSVWKRIGVCTSLGEYCTVILKESMDMPRGLALYPMTGEMFWSDFGEKAQISRAGMDGRERSALVTEDLIWPNGIAIDYPNRRLYWVDAKREIIESILLDGRDRHQVLRTTASHPYAIAVFEDKLYWSDWITKTIQSAEKYSGKNRSTIVRDTDSIYGIHIYHPVLKPHMANPCNAKPCSQLCLLALNRTYSCACSLDKQLSLDRHTCRLTRKHQNLVIAADDSFIDYYHEILGKPKMTGSLTMKRMTHLAYDSITGSLIANDETTGSIFRFDRTTETIQRITNCRSLGGMDFDFYGNNVYCSDTQRRTIVINSLDTNEIAVLNFIEEPRDILILPKHGVMLVVFKFNDTYHIDKVQMTGAGARIHLVEGLVGPKVSMAYDQESDRLFWSDETTGKIETISLNGNSRNLFRSGLRKPVSLAVVDQQVFWTLRRSKVLQWADKQDRVHGFKGVTLRINPDVEIMDIVATGAIFSGNQHYCRKRNGGCSHVCLVAVNGLHVCACPPGMLLNPDKRTCSLQTVCSPDEIRCSGNNECINKMRRCNGLQDCPNGEDEEKCDHIKTCGLGEFSCSNGQCIDSKGRCNSVFDCRDQSDEANCDKKDCKNDEFQCLDGQCITKFHVCDGHNDCEDFSDEFNCERHVCDEGSFRCTSGRCIPKSWECDGDIDCSDSSDEANKNCVITVCPTNMFQCSNRRCLDRALVCDRIDDCGDNSDEKKCNKPITDIGGSCSPNEYKCHGTEKCISLKFRCNGEQDCPKNDDEHHCAQCEPDEFVCENKRCIHQSWLCDDMDDCGDKSDEANCDIINHKKTGNFTIVRSIECAEFKCAIGICLPWEKVCDGKPDCIDASDEEGECLSSCTSGYACEQICQKTPAGPVCLCQKGYQLGSDGHSCEDVDECSMEICPQICHNQPGSFACSCFEGYILRSNRITCKVAGEAMEIITATKADIRKMSSSLSSIEVIHHQPNVDVTGLDVNMGEKTIYWSNGLLGTINRLNLRTKELKLVSGLGRPGVLAIDWATNNLYFHNGEKPSSIRACSLEEQKCAQIVKIESSSKLMSITVDPKNGWLFWSQTYFETFEKPVGEIYRADMSGSNQMRIAHERISVVSGITIDHTRSHLYWADAVLQVVERSNLDGNDRRVFLQQQIYQPLGLNIYEDSVFWLMGASGVLNKCALHGDKACESIHVKTSNVNQLFVISQKSRQPNVKNVCENHPCPHMCVIKNDEFVCICPNGDIADSKTTCDENAVINNSVQFQSAVLGMASPKVHSKSGLISGVFITIAVGIAVASGYYYFQRKKMNFRNMQSLSIHFQNPSFGRRPPTGITGDCVAPFLPPGEHEYINPLTGAQETKVQTLKSTGRRILEIGSDHSENELDEVPCNHNTHLLK